VFESFGMHGERLDSDGVHAKEPALSTAIRHGVFFPDDRQIEPDSLTRALVKRCQSLGVHIVEHCAVDRFLRTGDRVTGVVTEGGRQQACDVLLLAAGVWSGPLSAKLGVPMPIRPGKGYSIDYRPAPVQLRTSLTLEDERVAVTPLDGMVRLAGTMEFGGFEESVNDVRVEAIRRAAAKAFTDWGEPGGDAAPWAGLRPMTPDGLPIIGKLGPLSNAYIASGHGMLGLTLAPATADIVTDMITRQRMPLVAAAVSPDRFLSRRKRRRI
jgi:D-amino-acid dehydrogenase